MPVETLDDLAGMFHDWDVVAIDGQDVRGVWSRNYVETLGIEGATPTFLCRAVDVEDVVHGSTVLAGGIAHRVVEVQPDGTGLMLLILEET